MNQTLILVFNFVFIFLTLFQMPFEQVWVLVDWTKWYVFLVLRKYVFREMSDLKNINELCL